MKTLRTIFSVVILIIVSNTCSKAQDTIFLKNKETILARVLEINLETIVYTDYDNQDGPKIMLDKNTVIKIVYANGKTFFINKNEYAVGSDSEIRNKKRAVKFELFSPLTNDLCFGYEQMIKVGMNLEAKVAVIGPGVTNSEKKPEGFFVKAGLKLSPGSDYVIRGLEYAHGMRGRYIKPEIIFNNYTVSTDYYSGYNTTTDRVTNTCFAINIVFGKQSILGKSVTFDYYIGLGYGWQNSTLRNTSSYDYLVYDPYCYSHVFFGKSFPMILSAGMTMGYLF